MNSDLECARDVRMSKEETSMYHLSARWARIAAILVAIVVTLIPLLRRRDGQLDEMYDEK